MVKLKYEVLAEKLQFKNFFYLEYWIFYMIGFDLNTKLQTWKHPFVTISSALAILLLMMGMAHFSWLNSDDVSKVTDALGPFVQSTLGIWKCICFVYKLPELVDLLHRVWEFTEKSGESELKIIAKANQTSRRLGLIYGGFMSFAVVMNLMAPLLNGIKLYWTDGEFIYRPPLTASYPFVIDGLVLYVFTYLWTVYGIFFVVCFTFGTDVLYSWCVYNITAQFQVLHGKIDALNVKNKRKITQNLAVSRAGIIHCIAYHQQAIALAEQLNRGFRPIVLAEFTLNAAQLCFIAFQLGRGVEMERLPYYFSFMLTILMQLLLYCYGGQHLENESSNVAIVVYENLQWQFSTIKERKMLMLTILRAQKPCIITAIFFVVNMRLFVWVMQTSASYVTLLWSIG